MPYLHVALMSVDSCSGIDVVLAGSDPLGKPLLRTGVLGDATAKLIVKSLVLTTLVLLSEQRT